jgi:LmbE family N-acetylglucosaminyl deacetylase
MSELPVCAWVGVFAHPDDEWLAGWPVFQRADLKLGAIFFVGDNRAGGQGDDGDWRPRLMQVLEGLGIDLLGCLECTPDFYRLPRSERGVWRDRLGRLLEESRAAGPFSGARVVTHNPMGEYGHPDHIEVHRAVLDVCDEGVLVSDLAYEEPPSPHVRRIFFRGAEYGPYHLDRVRWAAARAAYASSLKWTAREWPSTDVARLYEL